METSVVEEEIVEAEIVIDDISIGEIPAATSRSAEDDAFSQRGEIVKSFDGLARGFKARVTRKENTLQKRFEGTEGAKSKRIDDRELTGYNLFEVVLPPYNLEYLAKIYESSSSHHSAVNAKAANIVGLGYDFIQSRKAKRKLETLAEDEDRTRRAVRKLAEARDMMVEWLESCNSEDDFLETLRKVWVDYESTGNGYIEIGRSKNGAVQYIGHIPSSSVRIRHKRDGFVQIVENRAVFFRNFGDEDPDPIGGDPTPNEIIHLKKYSPTNGYYGVPDIVSALSAVAGDEFANRYNLDYFENKAVPRYIIVVKGAKLGDVAERRLHDFFKTGLKGKNHRSLYVPLPADSTDHKTSFEIKPVEANVQDSSFNNYRKQNLATVLMAHRVPISKVSLAEGVSLAVAKDADKTFKEQVCRPEQRILENKLAKLVREFTDALYLKLDEMTLTDEDTQSKIDERYLRMQTVMPNEVRARMKLPAIKDGDSPVDLKAQQAAEQRATAQQSRTRDAQRSGNASDKDGGARNPKGEGRQSS